LIPALSAMRAIVVPSGPCSANSVTMATKRQREIQDLLGLGLSG
jgi:hypothetical protein